MPVGVSQGLPSPQAASGHRCPGAEPVLGDGDQPRVADPLGCHHCRKRAFVAGAEGRKSGRGGGRAQGGHAGHPAPRGSPTYSARTRGAGPEAMAASARNGVPRGGTQFQRRPRKKEPEVKGSSPATSASPSSAPGAVGPQGNSPCPAEQGGGRPAEGQGESSRPPGARA